MGTTHAYTNPPSVGVGLTYSHILMEMDSYLAGVSWLPSAAGDGAGDVGDESKCGRRDEPGMLSSKKRRWLVVVWRVKGMGEGKGDGQGKDGRGGVRAQMFVCGKSAFGCTIF